MKEIEGSSVILLGYGREGQSTHRYLHNNYPDKKIGIADREHVKPIEEATVKLHTGSDYLKSLLQYEVIVRSPGVPSKLPEVQNCIRQGRRVTSATNIFFSECPGTIVGVTGTKGKSTTSSLITNILEKEYPDVRLVGNIGRPALDYLPNATRNTLFVAELSSQQLEDVRYSPHIAVILNVFPEHLDYHRKFSDYVKAKGNIVRYQTTENIVVFNAAHEIATQLANKSAGQKFRFSLERRGSTDCYIDEGSIFISKESGKAELVMSSEEIPLLGKGNLEDVLAAVSVGVLLDIPLAKIREAIRAFKPLAHRLEFVGERQGIKFYNDSLSTIPEATIHALDALGPDVVTLIAGGYDRGLDFSELGEFLAKRPVKTLILLPTTGESIWKAVQNATLDSPPPRKFDVSSMEQAVQIAFKETPPGKICLLSPASASFGLFRDYEERGELFKQYILK